jgi:transketolase C-terminal domain/subunit
MLSCVFTLPTTKQSLLITVENYTVCDGTGSVVALVRAGA